MAPRAHRGFWASFQYLTLIGGQLCAIFVAILLQAVLTEAQLTAWGWRIPFVIGALLALGVYLLRRGLAETPSFEHQAATRPLRSEEHTSALQSLMSISYDVFCFKNKKINR